MIVILISGTISPVFSYANAEESDIFPTWVRFMFEEWAKGQVSDMELKHALEFLLTNNILKLEKEKTQTALPKISTTTPALSNFYESQKSNISINDGNFFSVAQNAVTGWIKEIKNNPTANLLAISALPVIPVVGPLLANLYDNAEGSPEQKNTMILEQLQIYQQMNSDQLALAFAKLNENKVAIEKNTYKLDDLLKDTKEILNIVKETNIVVKDIDKTTGDTNKKIDQLIALVNSIKVGKNTVATSEIVSAAKEVTQEYANSSDLGISQLEALAKSYLVQNQLSSAIIVYNKILNQNPSNFDALSEKGWAEYDMGRYEDSLETFEEFAKHYPGESEAWEGIGWNLIELNENNFDEAYDNFLKSYNLDNNNLYAVAGIGWVHLLYGQCEEAKNALNFVLQNDPNNPDGLELEREMAYNGC